MIQVKGLKTPRFAQLIEWVFNPLQLIEKSAKTYGDTFKLFLVGNNPMVFLSHPQAIKEIFDANDEIKQLIGSILEISGSPLKAMVVFVPLLQKDLGAWSPWGSFLRQQKWLDDLLYIEIQERRDNPDASREDILSFSLIDDDFMRLSAAQALGKLGKDSDTVPCFSKCLLMCKLHPR